MRIALDGSEPSVVPRVSPDGTAYSAGNSVTLIRPVATFGAVHSTEKAPSEIRASSNGQTTVSSKVNAVPTAEFNVIVAPDIPVIFRPTIAEADTSEM
jgi:hypothetical protein